MRAWIVSDIHTSQLDLFFRRSFEVPEADICVCAGDISDRIERSLDFIFSEIAPHMSVVMTLGNHDFYGSSIDWALEYVRKWTAGTNVRMLEDEEFRKGDLRIIGATLWTDFEIAAHVAGHLPVNARRDLALSECTRSLLDFRRIYRSDLRKEDEGGFIPPSEMISRHRASRAYIDTELAKPFEGTTMILTHHAPTARSLDPRFAGDISNAAFGSDLSEMIQARKPTFWVHGHVHCFLDYVTGKTRVLCNPRGYDNEFPAGGFRPGFVVETSPQIS